MLDYEQVFFCRRFTKNELLEWIPHFYDESTSKFLDGFTYEKELYREPHHRFPSGLRIYDATDLIGMKYGCLEYDCEGIVHNGRWYLDKDEFIDAVMKKEDWNEHGEQVDIVFNIPLEKLREEDEVRNGVNQ